MTRQPTKIDCSFSNACNFMSSQTGVFYFDLRPVPLVLEQELFNALGPADRDARGKDVGPGLVLAHAAIWIDDFAANERQPHTSALGNKITFDGRLDNRQDLLQRLCGYLHGDQTDCAMALSAYEAWGVEGLVNLVGDWSIAVLEPATHSVLLASDYAGVRPLYYHANHERVVWSSHLKPLVSMTRATDLDDHFVAGFLAGTGSPNRTPYRGILSVPPGHALRFGAQQVHTHAFWKLPVHNEVRYEDERLYDEQLRALFRKSVRARLRTRRPVLSELSGGLDSSSIVCMASNLVASRQAEAPEVVSVSFGQPGAPDEKFYRTVQSFCSVESVYLNTDNFPFFSLDCLDDASPAPWGALFNQLATCADRMDARVYFTGLGGDLVMGNFVEDTEQLAGFLRLGEIRTAFREAIGWSRATRVPLPGILWRGFRAAMPADWPVASKYEVLRNPAIRERYDDSLLPQFKSKVGLRDPDGIWSTRWKQAPPERRKHFKSLSRILESRFFRPPERLQHLYYTHPYSHRPLVEFLLAIPANVLCGPGEPRRLMRRAFRELLPPEVVRRRSKASFTGTFLQSVRPAARALLDRTRPLLLSEYGYVDPTKVRERLERITQSLTCNEPQLRQIVLLEHWLRAQPQYVRKAA
jgi:asparagine synthase (glutamine-hydrolysing)